MNRFEPRPFVELEPRVAPAGRAEIFAALSDTARLGAATGLNEAIIRGGIHHFGIDPELVRSNIQHNLAVMRGEIDQQL